MKLKTAGHWICTGCIDLYIIMSIDSLWILMVAHSLATANAYKKYICYFECLKICDLTTFVQKNLNVQYYILFILNVQYYILSILINFNETSESFAVCIYYISFNTTVKIILYI